MGTRIAMSTINATRLGTKRLDDVDACLDSQAVRAALDGLPGLEREIVRLEYGIGGGRPGTLDDIAAKLGISRDQVRKLERLAFRRLCRS
jgi:RNA polymerase primary sigma factor